MLKRVFILALCCLCLFAFGCAANGGEGKTDNEGASEEPPKSYCVDYKGASYCAVQLPTLADTDDTLFLLYSKKVYFTDKEHKDWLPLCGKPECSHKGLDCNAYINSECLVLYDRYLYYVEGSGYHSSDKYKVKLCRMGFDGTSHETVCDLRALLAPELDFVPDQADWEIAATNKYLIICAKFIEGRGSADGTIHKYYYSFDMETQQFVPIFTEYSSDPSYSGFVLFEGVGDRVYGAIYRTRNDDSDPSICKLVEADLATGATREYCDFTGNIRYYEKAVGVVDGKLYFIDNDPPRLVEVEDPEKDTASGGADDDPEGEDTVEYEYVYTEEEQQRLYSLDLETGELELIAEAPILDSKWLVIDSNAGYMYSSVGIYGDPREGDGFYVCDMNRNVIDFIPASEYPEGFEGVVSIGRITNDYIFAMLKAGNSISDEKPPVWYLNKADIGTGNLAWRKWEPEG